MLDRLKKEDLDPFVEKDFQLSSAEGHKFQVQLVEVTEMPGTPSNRKPFSVVFLGPGEPVLPQCIYTLEHEKIGPLDLFLVPLGPFRDGMKYEAVFT